MQIDPNRDRIHNRIAHLQEEHKLLDDQIDRLERSGGFDDKEINLLKKKRLHLRDEIANMERKQELAKGN